MASVAMIPATAAKPDILRVAAYCRVSSDSTDQLHSYAAQIRNYTQVIQEHMGWELVDVYADEGLTGTRMDQREDFNRMIADCRKGRIDKIVVKSISRFARNTRDCLATLRELFSLGVTVKFEKENIDTGTLTSELMVSVSGCLAQEESVSISKNQRMSYQRRMERGEFITCKAPIGYQLVDGKNMTIVPDEAEIVRWIFQSYLEGKSADWIAQRLNERTDISLCGRNTWHPQAIQKILTNEKYIGDALCQKTYTTNTFPFCQRRNHGEMDQYYVEHTHPAMISREDFQKVQMLMEQRAERTAIPHKSSPLAKKIVCGQCGTLYLRRITRTGSVAWVCRKHDRRAADCPNGRIRETDIFNAFLRMYQKVKANEDIVIRPMLKQLENLADALHQNNPAMLAVNKAIAQAAEQSYNLMKLHTAGLLDTETLTARQTAVNAKLAQLRRERRQLLNHEDIDEQVDAIHRTAERIHNGPENLEGVDEGLFHELVDNMIVDTDTCLRFRLYGGLEFKERLGER